MTAKEKKFYEKQKKQVDDIKLPTTKQADIIITVILVVGYVLFTIGIVLNLLRDMGVINGIGI